MHVEVNQDAALNVVTVSNLVADQVTRQEVEQLKSLIYKNKMIVLKHQDLTPKRYLDFTRLIGTPEAYYQQMYHHPEFKEIFVSSNIPKNGAQVGVPSTGAFWHSDYSFMPKPFAFTAIYPQVTPKLRRSLTIRVTCLFGTTAAWCIAPCTRKNRSRPSPSGLRCTTTSRSMSRNG